MNHCVYCRLEITGEERDGPAETIADGAQHVHRACFVRMVVGSVGHQKKQCSCYGGVEEDPAGLDRREAALAAWEHFMGERGGLKTQGGLDA